MKSLLAEFKEFINRGNVIDMAVGIIIGAAFTAIVTSLTDDIINPLIKLITGGNGTDVAGLTIPVAGTENGIDFGAFIDIGVHQDGLVHISQISLKRIKSPSDVLNVGDEVNVKIIGVKDGKISLSMKALEEEKKEEEEIHVEIPKAEEIGTSLGDLFKGLKLD